MEPGILYSGTLNRLLPVFLKKPSAMACIFGNVYGKLCFHRYLIPRRYKSKAFVANLCFFLAVELLIVIAFSACGQKKTDVYIPRREVSVYSEKSVPVVFPYQLFIQCDYGDFEFYNWDEKAVKFEITHRVRAGKTEDELAEMLKKFSTVTSEKAGRISFLCSYGGKDGNYQDTFSTVRIFMPGNPGAVEGTLKEGKLTFYDDLNCRLELDTGKADVEINRLKGIVEYTGKSGNLRISSGELYNGSSITTSTGNIRIKSYFECPGSYTFHTGTGIIDLGLPSDLNAVFESSGRVNTNEVSVSDASSRFLLKCGLGKINIHRF